MPLRAGQTRPLGQLVLVNFGHFKIDSAQGRIADVSNNTVKFRQALIAPEILDICHAEQLTAIMKRHKRIHRLQNLRGYLSFLYPAFSLPASFPFVF